MTNPVGTLVFKALICIKARDALIVSCHRDAANVEAMTVDGLRQVLARHGASVDLVQSVPRRPTRRTIAALMSHSDVSMILATGGTAMVKAAYSSGYADDRSRAGNAPAWVARPTSRQLPRWWWPARHLITASSAARREQPCRRSVCERLFRRRAMDGRRGRAQRSGATSIAAEAGIEVPVGTRLLVAPVPRQAGPGPYGKKARPTPVAVTSDGEDDGIRLCLQILGNGGAGHTAIIHTRRERLQLSFAQQMPASRVLVNGPGCDFAQCLALGHGVWHLASILGRVGATPSFSWRFPETGGGSVEMCRSGRRLWTRPPSRAGNSRQQNLGIRENPHVDHLPAAIYGWGSQSVEPGHASWSLASLVGTTGS